MPSEIVVSDYDPAWPSWFERVHAHVWPAVSEIAIRIDHVGSTSVPGLAAKPIIDLDIVVAGEDEVQMVIGCLGGVGYEWVGDLGVEGRQAFRAIGAVGLPGSIESAEGSGDLPPHNLYLVVEDNRAHMDHWLLRDLLCNDVDARERYAEIKRRNAALADGDIDAYVALKATFVAGLLTRARAERGFPPVSYWDPELTG